VEVVNAVPDAESFDIRGISAPDGIKRAAQDSNPTIVHLQGAAPGWFALVEVPIVLGRDVSLADTAAPDHPIVIGSDLARRLYGDANPIGRVLASPTLLPKQDSIAMTVVGVYDASVRLPGMTFMGGTARSNSTDRVYSAHGKKWRLDRLLVRTRS